MNEIFTHPSRSTKTAERLLSLHNVSVRYGNNIVVEDLSFSVEAGRIVCLLGPSGCGKTTVLRAIAGFEPVAAGEIRLNADIASRKGWSLAPERRRVGMVFQDYALFPHMTVAQNVMFGLRQLAAGEQQERLNEVLTTLGLDAVAARYPHELSGGQQQRVALARALAPRPHLLLLDEPFSNLDVELRERLSQEVREILHRYGVTAVMVTHHQYEAFAMADEVGVMHAGRLQQWDNAYNLYHEPANRFVADFVGEGVFLPGTVLSPNSLEIELGILKLNRPSSLARGTRVDVLLRPDDVIHDDRSALSAEVMTKAFRGADILYTLRLAGGGRVLSLVPSHHNHAIGERIGIKLEVDHVVYFPRLN